MNIVWSEAVDTILSVGTLLGISGENNWALTRPDALLAIKRLENMGVAVLGGDVCDVIDGEVVHNYDNWRCRDNPYETPSDYATRSADESVRYISSYPAT